MHIIGRSSQNALEGSQRAGNMDDDRPRRMSLKSCHTVRSTRLSATFHGDGSDARLHLGIYKFFAFYIYKSTRHQTLAPSKHHSSTIHPTLLCILFLLTWLLSSSTS